MKKVPVRLADEQADEPAIVHDLRVLVEANRKLREEISEMVSRRTRADLRASIENHRRRACGRADSSDALPRRRGKGR